MATYTITTGTQVSPVDYTSLGVRVSGDVFNINGGYLLVDCDTRYGFNGAAAAGFGAIALSATLGGSVEFNSTNVKIIPYSGGTGTVPPGNTVISQGGASGKLIGVYSDINVAPTAAAAAMPAGGFIKIRQWNGVSFAAGALTGLTANATGAEEPGWLEIVGVDAATATVNRLNKFIAKGEYYYFRGATTTGTSSTIYQLPTNGSAAVYVPGVEVETAVGSGVYEVYPRAGSITALAAKIAVDPLRGRWCWISTSGEVRFGHDGTNSTGGYCPPAGCKVRVPNLFFVCCAAAAAVNIIPNATLATRYDFTTTGSGYISLDTCCINWYLSLAQPYYVNMKNVLTFEQISLTEAGVAFTLDNVGVGQTAANTQTALNLAFLPEGGTINNCTLSRATLAAAGAYVVAIADSAGLIFTNNRIHSLVKSGNASSGGFSITRLIESEFSNTLLGGCGRMFLSTATVKVSDTTYYDHPATTTLAAMPMYVFDLAAMCIDCEFSGLSFGGLVGVQPYSGILNIGAAGCLNTKLRNIGTEEAPLDMGHAQVTASWSNSGSTTINVVTPAPHNLKAADIVYVLVSSNTTYVTVGAKTVVAVGSSTTFTFAGVTGTASGTIEYFLTVSAYGVAIAASAAAIGVYVQRVYLNHLRTGFTTMDNSSKNIYFENCAGPAYLPLIPSGINTYVKQVACKPALTAQTAVYGTHIADTYHSYAPDTSSMAWNTAQCAYNLTTYTEHSSDYSKVRVVNGNSGTVFGTPIRGSGKVKFRIQGNKSVPESSGVLMGLAGPGGALTIGYNFNADRDEQESDSPNLIVMSGTGAIQQGPRPLPLILPLTSIVVTDVDICIDLDQRLVWLGSEQLNGVWNNSLTANPDLGVGGITIPWAGDILPYSCIRSFYGTLLFIGLYQAMVTAPSCTTFSPVTFNSGATVSTVATVATVTYPSHGLITGDIVYVTQVPFYEYIPIGLKTVTAVDKNTFKFTCTAGVDLVDYPISYTPTVGRINVQMNEGSMLTAPYVSTLSGTPAFTATGGLYLPNVGDSVKIQCPYELKGHSRIVYGEATMAGGTLTNYDVYANVNNTQRAVSISRPVYPVVANAVASLVHTSTALTYDLMLDVYAGASAYLNAKVTSCADNNYLTYTQYVLNATAISYPQIVRLSSSSALLTYQNASANLYAVVLSVSPTFVVTMGSPVLVADSVAKFCSLLCLPNGTILLGYTKKTQSNFYADLLEVTDTTVSILANRYTVSTGLTYSSDDNISIAMCGSTILIASCGYGGTNNMAYIGASWDGAVLTFGTPLVDTSGRSKLTGCEDNRYIGVSLAQLSRFVVDPVTLGVTKTATGSSTTVAVNQVETEILYLGSYISPLYPATFVDSVVVVGSYGGFALDCFHLLGIGGRLVRNIYTLGSAFPSTISIAKAGAGKFVVSYLGASSYINHRLIYTSTNLLPLAGITPTASTDTLGVYGDPRTIKPGMFVFGTNIPSGTRVMQLEDQFKPVVARGFTTLPSGILRFSDICELELDSDGSDIDFTFTTRVANVTAITSLYLNTYHTAYTRAKQHPLDLAMVSLTGLVSGSRVKASRIDTGEVLFSGAESGGSVTFTTDYVGLVRLEARKASSAPYYIPWSTQLATISGETVSAFALQQLDS